MRNSFAYIALGFVLAFFGAVIYTILYVFGLLSGAVVFAVLGVLVSILVLGLITLVFFAGKSGCKYCLHTAFSCYGIPLIFTAIGLLISSATLIAVFGENGLLYIIVQFAVLFLWIFLLILWVLVLRAAIPQTNCGTNCGRDTQSDCTDSVYGNSSRYRY